MIVMDACTRPRRPWVKRDVHLGNLIFLICVCMRTGMLPQCVRLSLHFRIFADLNLSYFIYLSFSHIELSSADLWPFFVLRCSLWRLLWVEIAAGWGRYDTGRLLSLLQPWWIIPVTEKKSLLEITARLSRRRRHKCCGVLFGWWMNPSLTDDCLSLFA